VSKSLKKMASKEEIEMQSEGRSKRYRLASAVSEFEKAPVEISADSVMVM